MHRFEQTKKGGLFQLSVTVISQPPVSHPSVDESGGSKSSAGSPSIGSDRRLSALFFPSSPRPSSCSWLRRRAPFFIPPLLLIIFPAEFIASRISGHPRLPGRRLQHVVQVVMTLNRSSLCLCYETLFLIAL